MKIDKYFHLYGRKDDVVFEEIPAPSAQPERKTGKWINRKDEDYCGGGYAKCSVCGHKFSWGAFFGLDEFRFCPDCGAEMKGEEK